MAVIWIKSFHIANGAKQRQTPQILLTAFKQQYTQQPLNRNIQIQKINEDVLTANIQFVLDKLIEIINKSGKTFNSLLFANQQAKISRYFQIVFLSLYQFLVEENSEIISEKELIKHLDKAGDKTIKLAAGGGNWSAKEKQTQTDALCGVIRSCFEKKTENDPARNQWITRFENILMQSSTEQALYDFKVGLYPLNFDEGKLNKEAFSKIIKTLTAMANTFPNSTGYCLLGVADNKSISERYKEIYGSNCVSYGTFFVTGINSEAKKYHGDIDKYFTRITQLVAQEPLSDRDKDNISRNILTVNYFEKTVIIFKIESGNNPSIYNGKYYVRHGSNISEVKPENFSELFARFIN
jgi:Putative DNA-binding domain